MNLASTIKRHGNTIGFMVVIVTAALAFLTYWYIIKPAREDLAELERINENLLVDVNVERFNQVLSAIAEKKSPEPPVNLNDPFN